MKQADLGLNLSAKRTRKREFLEQMDRVVPWAALVGLIEPVYGKKSGVGRPPFALASMLRIHFLQQWFDRYQSVKLHNFKISDLEMAEGIGSPVKIHPCRTRGKV